MFSNEPDLINLVHPEDWQGIQNSLSEVIGVTLSTLSPEGKLLFRSDRATRLCSDILPKGGMKYGLCCRIQFESFFPDVKNITTEANLKCPFDLDIFVIPIKAVGEKVIANLILGPVMLKDRKQINEYRSEAEELGIALGDLEDALIDVNVFSYNKINAVIKLTKDVFSHIAQTEYHKRRLGEIGPQVAELDPLFAGYYEERILSSLLNCCTLALDADSGSVMTVDRKTNMMHIKVASKLDDEIVNNTELKVGEGIAGVAAATAESIVLPRDEGKNGLSEKMKRKYIKSSIVVPFNKKDARGVYGVINLNIVRKEEQFSEKDISLVKELVNMASVALVPLRQ